MTTRKRLAHRRAVNQRLAEQDAANRCHMCRLPFSGVIFVSILTRGRFCCENCQLRAEDLEQMTSSRGVGCYCTAGETCRKQPGEPSHPLRGDRGEPSA